jgi:cytochrome c-type biogenesis protein CcmH/NrfF
VFALLGLGLAGVAVLLVAVVPISTMPMPWVLWALPLSFFALAALLAWRVQQQDDDSAFDTLRAQIAQDLATLKILDAEA